MGSLGIDFAFAPRARTTWQLDERGLAADVIPVYAGVREYQRGGRIVREFRDPEQVKSPGFRRTLERMPCVIGHPVDAQGRYIFPSATASLEGEVCSIDPSIIFYPHRVMQVGTVGDTITDVEIDGMMLPKQRAQVTDPRAIGLIKGLGSLAPRDEVSIGFIKHNLAIPGVWKAPDGREVPYDELQIIDPTDERVPEEERRFLGAYYLGVAFPRGGSRGEFTRFAIDAKDATPRRGRSPRTFYMVRHADESGVSGIGHVLDGIVWPNGKVNAAWCSEQKPSSIETWDGFDKFLEIHVNAHPGNSTEIVFDDGEPPPAGPLPIAPNEDDADSSSGDTTMTPEEMQKMLESLQAENAALKTKLAQFESQAAADKAAADKAAKDAEGAAMQEMKNKQATMQAACDSLEAKNKALEAELAPLRAERAKEARARIAGIAGIDAKDLAEVPIDKLEVEAMRKRFAAGLDAKPSHGFADDDAYLRGRFADLEARAAAEPIERAPVSPGFARAGASAGASAGADAKNNPPTDPLAALP